MADQANVFRFMVLSAPELPAADAARRNLIREPRAAQHCRVDRDLFSAVATSAISKLIYQLGFCSDDVPTPAPTPITSLTNSRQPGATGN